MLVDSGGSASYFEDMRIGSWLQRPFKYNYYNATIGIIVVNIVLFVVSSMSQGVIRELALIPYLVIRRAAVWQVVTYMFLHGGFWHVLLNMLALFLFGIEVERKMGSSEFILYYLTAGIGAGLFTLIVHWYAGRAFVPVVGASGAVYGLLLAYATFFPTARILIFGILPLRAPIAVLLFAAVSLFSHVTGGGAVAHLTHLAGIVVGYAYFLVRFRINPVREFFP